MFTDVHCWVGEYPYRDLPADSVDALLADLDALRIESAWVGHLPAAFGQSPAESNKELVRLLAPHADRLRPTPAVNPGEPAWGGELELAAEVGAPAVRIYPSHWGLEVGTPLLRDLMREAGEHTLPVLVTVQFEDVRQRDPRDVAQNIGGAMLRSLVRADPQARLVVAAASRSLLEEVHWGLTPAEAERVWWDISHIWGPFEDDLSHLVAAVGPDRFVLGTHWPLRIRDASIVRLELLSDMAAREVIESRNSEMAEDCGGHS